MVRPAFQFMRDTAAHLQPQPGNGADHQRVDAHAILQSIQATGHAFVYEADGADLYPDQRVRPIFMSNWESDFMSVVDELQIRIESGGKFACLVQSCAIGLPRGKKHAGRPA